MEPLNAKSINTLVSPSRRILEQMMGTMQQLLQAKSADESQQEDKSGGSGRGDENDDSGGAGRVPRKEGAVGTRVGVTAKTAAGGKMSSHSSRASDGLRPADDTGRRPEVPADVGPMINMQRGEAGDSFLAGATHDSDGGLSSGLQRQSRVVPPVLKGEFQKFMHEFLLKPNMLDISGHFVGQGTRSVPVKDPCKQSAVLLRESFSSEEIRGAHQAWNFIDVTPQSEADISILKRC